MLLICDVILFLI